MKISIFDVDLGLNINDVITNDIQELTNETKTQLDNTIELAKVTQKIRIESEAKKKNAETKLVEDMNKAYAKLVETVGVGIPTHELLAMVSESCASHPSFSLRMNKILFAKGNPYKLMNKTVKGMKMTLFSTFIKS